MSNSLPDYLYTCEQTRVLEQICIQKHGVAGIVLMKRAGRGALRYAQTLWPELKAPLSRQWVVLCGTGNNAGDGYIFAALAAQKRQNVIVLHAGSLEQLKGDALTAYEFAKAEGVEVCAFAERDLLLGDDDVFIDALLGTGLSGSVRSEYVDIIEWMNNFAQPVLSLDVPSGLCANSGSVQGVSVRAFATITFVTCKTGLLTGRGPGMTGALMVDGLEVPEDLYTQIADATQRVDFTKVCALPKRDADAHKGLFGHLMVVGGDYGYGGAAILAGEAAVFSGAGMVSLATRSEHVAPALVRRPELMAVGVASGQELEPLLTRPSVLVVGPGLGLSPWSEQMLQQSLNCVLPMVLDADALTILAQGKLRLPDAHTHVLTPHPGEAGRLLACTTDEVQADRVVAVKALQEKYGGIIVLKGAGTLIYDGNTLVLANVGNSGLATAGTGDVLSGIIGACISQGLSAFDASKYAVCVHGAAADQAVEMVGERGLLASELIPHVRELMRKS